MTIAELRAARQTAWAKAEALDAKGKTDPLSTDELAAFDAAIAECEGIDADIKASEDAAAATAKRSSTFATMRAAQTTGTRRTQPDANTPTVTNVRDRVLDDPKRGFATFGHFALEILNAGPSMAGVMGNAKLMAAAGTGMRQGVTADGGVLVPPGFSKEIWDGARQQSDSMLQYCDVIPVDPGVESVTFPAVNETSRADGSRWGGIRGYWKGELSQMTESKPALREVTVRPQELYVFSYISDKLLRNAPGAASVFLKNGMADEINFKIGDAIFNGDGAGKPVGVIGHASVVSIAKETGQGLAAGTPIVTMNINKMYGRTHAKWRSGAAWFINQDLEPYLESLKIDIGTGGQALYIPPGGMADAPLGRLKGLPVIPCEYCATAGTVGDIVLGNLGAYCFGMRGLVDQSESMHLKFDYAQTAFRLIFEGDGQPWLASAITPKNGTNTLSPIVTLATRA